MIILVAKNVHKRYQGFLILIFLEIVGSFPKISKFRFASLSFERNCRRNRRRKSFENRNLLNFDRIHSKMTLAPHSRKKICYYYDSKYLFWPFYPTNWRRVHIDAIKAKAFNTVDFVSTICFFYYLLNMIRITIRYYLYMSSSIYSLHVLHLKVKQDCIKSEI